ncbi:MAG: thiol:disulfide interchange protein DsbA/DsbL, partial [Pseudohongiella sp.]|nr:thiol:disulfide interchange protein DsbA/DsbL [Pseudohongiella sp.]
MIKSIIRYAGTVVLLAFMGSAVNAQPSLYVAGTHYEELPAPVRTNNPDKIEILEVFWYGCGHCFRFQPLVD